MDTATLKFLALFSATAVFSIMAWITLSCCCWLLSYLYSKPNLKTTDGATHDIEMAQSVQQQLVDDYESNYFQELNTDDDLAQEDVNIELTNM